MFHHPCLYHTRKHLSYRPAVEGLESRVLQSSAPWAPPALPAAVTRAAAAAGPVNLNLHAEPLDTSGRTTVTPAMMRHAYGFDQLYASAAAYNANAGRGETIAIVDAYDDPNLQSEVAGFDAAFGLPALREHTVYPDGRPGADPQGGWNYEEALDVEWVHALAPQATIVYVACLGPSLFAMADGVQAAVSYPGVTSVSLSWGAPAFSGDNVFGQLYFTPPAGHAPVTIFASAGDAAGELSWPGHDQACIDVGGTRLNVSASGRYLGERPWAQTGRGGAVAFDADPQTGVPVDVDGAGYQIGGTSLSSPCWAATMALIDQAREAHHRAAESTASFRHFLLHGNARTLAADFHHGGGLPGDGSPEVQRLVHDLSR